MVPFGKLRAGDPALSRWLSPDTLVPEAKNPQSLNRYSYVLGNPLRYWDPTGHSKIGDWLIETGKKIGNSGPVGKALVVGLSEAVNHVNQQVQKVFYPDENTDPVDRFWACVEIGGGTTVAAAPVAYAGSWVLGAIGGTTVAETGGATAAAACADGDCTNELQAALGLADHMFEFQYQVVPEAKAFTQWEQAGLSGPTFPNFPQAFESAMNNASRIHFNLTGIENVSYALELGSQGWGAGNMTNTELYLIVNNPDWFAKTAFYLNGVSLTLEEVLKLLGGQ